jgi:hypothetical protein
MMSRKRNRPRRVRHRLKVFAWVNAFMLMGSPTVLAEPNSGSASSPYPTTYLILDYYDKVNYDDYFTSSAGGVWFSTPLGLNCGIWDRGSFGCTGDIRGAPPGTTNIGWVNGNIVTRYDWLLGAQFPPGRGERELAPRSYIEYNGTQCATMADSSTYCVRGPFRFFVTPTRTWLSPRDACHEPRVRYVVCQACENASRARRLRVGFECL